MYPPPKPKWGLHVLLCLQKGANMRFHVFLVRIRVRIKRAIGKASKLNF